MKTQSRFFILLIIFAMSITHPVPTATASPTSGTSSQIDAQGWIAYIDQEQTLHVVHPDGSGDRSLYQIGQAADSGEISLQGWSVNGRFLAFGVWSNDKRSIFVWDSRVESGLIELKGATALFEGVLWNPQEEHLFATIQSINKSGQSSLVNQLEIWNVLSTEQVIVHPDAGYGFAWSPDGEQLFFDMPYMDTKAAGQAAFCPTMPTWVMYDGIYSYKVETGTTNRVITAKENPLHLDSVFPNGRELIVHEGVLFCTGMDGGCMQGQSYKVDLNHPDEWTSPFGSDCEWSPDGKLAACGGNQCGDDLIRIFDTNGKNIQTLSQFQSAFPSPAYTKHWSPNNQLLSIEEIGWLTWSYNKNVWDSNSGEIEKLPGNIINFDWSPDGKYYVACMTPENDLNCIFTIFDYETKTEVTRLGQGRGAYVDWQPQILPDAPANVSIRPDADKQTYVIEWDALNDKNVTYEVRYAFQEITESVWNGDDSYELHGDTQLENNRITLPVTIENSNGGRSRSKIFIGVRAVSENGIYSPISNTPWIVDWGFRPQKDGYEFSNSSPDTWTINPAADFTEDDFRRLFGDDKVCTRHYSQQCDLTFDARAKYKKFITWLSTYRCMGMAITSEKNYLKEPNLFDLVSNFENLYTEGKLEQVRRAIAYYHVQQDSNPSASSHLADNNLSFEEKVIKLIDLLQKNIGAVISFKISAGNWHAVTPIAVERGTNNQYRIWVYDNNYHKMIRPMYVDLNKNQLSYKWQDNAVSTVENDEESVDLTVGADFHVTPLNLFSERVEYITEINILQILGNSYLQIFDDANNLIGFLQNDYINLIPSAEIIPVANSFDSWDEPIYWLPDGARYTVNITPVSSESVSDLLFTWNGKTFTITIMRDRLTQPEQLIVGDEGKDLSYMPGETGPVSLSFSQVETEYETQIELQQYLFQPGDQLQIVYDQSEGDYLVTYSGKEEISGNLTITLHDHKGEHVIRKEGFQLQPDRIHHVQIENWSEQGIVRLGIDQDRDGQVDQWITERETKGIFSGNRGLLWGGLLILIGGLTLIVGFVLLSLKRSTQR